MLLMFVCSPTRWRAGAPDATGWRLGSGVVLMAVADIFYGRPGGRRHLYLWRPAQRGVSHLVLAAGIGRVGAVEPSDQAGMRAPDTIVLTFAAAVIALALLVVAAFSTVTPLAVGLAAGALGLATARSALTYLENVRILRTTSRQAVTDSLTGLAIAGSSSPISRICSANVTERQRLPSSTSMASSATTTRTGTSSVTHFFVRLAAALSAAVAAKGSAYRLGGDEFCVLLDGRYPPHDQTHR